MKNQMINRTEAFVRHETGVDPGGHDWFHIDRVRRNALVISKQERAGDPFFIEMAALLHDIPDEKLNESAQKGQKKLEGFLQTLPLSAAETSELIQIIATISFKGGNNSGPFSIEAKIVQDADRLDAIGAIGIARAFAYGARKGQPIFDPSLNVRENMSLEEYRNGKTSSIHHFYEKLLKLTGLLYTNTAKKLALPRQQMMENFLEEFYIEWNGQG